MTKLNIGIVFERGDGFGDRKARLLEAIEEHGSIRSAATAMSMSYRTAWLLLHSVTETFGAPIVTTAIGGNGGGGTKLTELGRKIVSCFRTIESEAMRTNAVELEQLTKTVCARNALTF